MTEKFLGLDYWKGDPKIFSLSCAIEISSQNFFSSNRCFTENCRWVPLNMQNAREKCRHSRDNVAFQA